MTRGLLKRLRCALFGHRWIVRPYDHASDVCAERNCECGTHWPAVVWPREVGKDSTIWSPTGPRPGWHSPAPPMPPMAPSKQEESAMTNIEPRIQVLSPKAGDTIALTFPTMLTDEQRAAIRAKVEPLLPEGVKVMLLDRGVSVTHVKSPA